MQFKAISVLVHTASSMAALIVVIVDKNEGSVGTSHTPAIIDQVAQLAVVLDTPRDFRTVAEFSHVPFRVIRESKHRVRNDALVRKPRT